MTSLNKFVNGVWKNKVRVSKAGGVGVLLFLAWQALQYIAQKGIDGILGNRIDAIFVEVLKQLDIAKSQSFFWISLILLVLLLLCVGIIILQGREIETPEKLARLNDSYRLLFERIITIAIGDTSSKEEFDNAFETLITDTLNRVPNLLKGDYVRGMVCLPNQDKSYLDAKYCTEEMTEAAMNRAHFYIGEPYPVETPDETGLANAQEKTAKARGIAGSAYQVGKLVTAKPIITPETKGGEVVPTKEGGFYICLDNSITIRSSISIPLSHKDEKGDQVSLGILCFESTVEGDFDNDEINQNILTPVADRVAFALLAQPTLARRFDPKVA